MAREKRTLLDMEAPLKDIDRFGKLLILLSTADVMVIDRDDLGEVLFMLGDMLEGKAREIDEIWEEVRATR